MEDNAENEQPEGFEWDDEKAAVNRRRHQVSFREASSVFRDGLAKLVWDEDHSEQESREIIIGKSDKDRLLPPSMGSPLREVFYTDRFYEPVGDVIRIISARPVAQQERKEYEENDSFYG